MILVHCDRCRRYALHDPQGSDAQCRQCGKVRDYPENAMRVRMGYVNHFCALCRRETQHDYKNGRLVCVVCQVVIDLDRFSGRGAKR